MQKARQGVEHDRGRDQVADIGCSSRVACHSARAGIAASRIDLKSKRGRRFRASHGRQRTPMAGRFGRSAALPAPRSDSQLARPIHPPVVTFQHAGDLRSTNGRFVADGAWRNRSVRAECGLLRQVPLCGPAQSHGLRVRNQNPAGCDRLGERSNL